MSAVASVGTLAIVIGFGAAAGGLVGTWSYRGGLGQWSVRAFRACMRYGTIAGVVGLMLVGIAAIAR